LHSSETLTRYLTVLFLVDILHFQLSLTSIGKPNLIVSFYTNQYTNYIHFATINGIAFGQHSKGNLSRPKKVSLQVYIIKSLQHICVVLNFSLSSTEGVKITHINSNNSPREQSAYATKRGDYEAAPIAEQLLLVQKWSILWRSIITSCLQVTLYPYCKYVRALDLRDLENLLDDGQFKGKVQEYIKPLLNNFFCLPCLGLSSQSLSPITTFQ
jgi:hypothetical protein